MNIYGYFLFYILGLFNILFAWLGLICFSIPLLMSILGADKKYCNKYCGRGQLYTLLGDKLKLSRNKSMPKFLRSKIFRYGFLTFFLIMLSSMLLNSYFVFTGARELKEVITLLWTFKLPWNFVELSNVSSYFAQFSFGFFSLMLTANIIGLITMLLYKPRSWCVYCPMGTMTQGICIIKNK